MTEVDESSSEERSRCKWCRRVLPSQKMGRRASSARRHAGNGTGSASNAAELQLSESELIITKDELDRLHDELYVLACAVNDAERDLAAAGAKPSVRELHSIVEWLLEAARPLRDRELQPPAR